MGLDGMVVSWQDTDVMDIADADCWKNDTVQLGNVSLCNVDYYHPGLYMKEFRCDYSGNAVYVPDIGRSCRVCGNGKRCHGE